MKKERLIYIILAVIAIVAAVIIGVKGLNFGLKYSPSKQIQINIGQEFKNSDIEIMVKEVIGNKEVIVQKVETYEEIVCITVKEITDEQIAQLNSKINDKYGTENTVDGDVTITDLPSLRARDLIRPYVLPIGLSLALIIIYAGFKFKKIEILEILGKVLGFNILAEVLYVSILAITRLPVNSLTIPIGIAIKITKFIKVISTVKLLTSIFNSPSFINRI